MFQEEQLIDDDTSSQPPLAQFDGEKEKPPDHPDNVDGKSIITLLKSYHVCAAFISLY